MYQINRNNYHSKPKNSKVYTPPAVSQFIFNLLKAKIPPDSLIFDPGCGLGHLLRPWQVAGYATLGIDHDPSLATKWGVKQKSDRFPSPDKQAWNLAPSFAPHYLKSLAQRLHADHLSASLKATASQSLVSRPASETVYLEADFLHLTKPLVTKELDWQPQLVLCNPPFNGAKPQLAPEIWLDKIIELFGKEIPLVLFVPAGFTLNLTLESARYRKFAEGIYPSISSRITLPKNIFTGVQFHSERLPPSNLQNPFAKGLEILIFNIKGLAAHYFFK